MLLSELMSRGFELLILGVGTLFSFMLVLFFLTRWMSRILVKYEGLHPVLVPVPLSVVRSNPERARIAAIAAAIHRHRIRLH